MRVIRVLETCVFPFGDARGYEKFRKERHSEGGAVLKKDIIISNFIRLLLRNDLKCS